MQIKQKHDTVKNMSERHISEILYDEAGIVRSFEERDIAGAGFARLVGELDRAAGERGVLVEATGDDPYYRFSWGTPAGEVQYEIPKSPADTEHSRRVTIDRPAKLLKTQLMRSGVPRSGSASRVEFDIQQPDIAHEGKAQVTAVTTSRRGTERSTPVGYYDLSLALRDTGITSEPGYVPPVGRTSSGH